MSLIISDGVIRCHYSIHLSFALPCEYPHRDCHGEGLEDFRIGRSRRLHPAIAVAVLSCPLHDSLNHLCLYLVIERRVSLPFDLAVKALLHITSDMLYDSLLGIPLHLRVDGCIDPEAVPVDVVLCSVRLHVLVYPTV